jgi:hypothetical protein
MNSAQRQIERYKYLGWQPNQTIKPLSGAIIVEAAMFYSVAFETITESPRPTDEQIKEYQSRYDEYAVEQQKAIDAHFERSHFIQTPLKYTSR